jgi:hypothetical protein
MDEKVIPVGVKEIKVQPLRKPARRWKDKVGDVKYERTKWDNTSTYENLQKNEEGFVVRKPNQLETCANNINDSCN